MCCKMVRSPKIDIWLNPRLKEIFEFRTVEFTHHHAWLLMHIRVVQFSESACENMQLSEIFITFLQIYTKGSYFNSQVPLCCLRKNQNGHASVSYNWIKYIYFKEKQENRIQSCIKIDTTTKALQPEYSHTSKWKKLIYTDQNILILKFIHFWFWQIINQNLDICHLLYKKQSKIFPHILT